MQKRLREGVQARVLVPGGGDLFHLESFSNSHDIKTMTAINAE